MERLSLHDVPPGHDSRGPPPHPNQHPHPHPPPLQQHAQRIPPPPMPPAGLPQLPPQMFTTAAQLLDLTDKKLMVVLRDGRKLIGVLRSWDQFANLVLQDTTERLYVPEASVFADISRGIFIVRGENVLLLGEIDLDKEDDVPTPYRQVPVEEAEALATAHKTKRKQHEQARVRRLGVEGFEAEGAGEILF